MQSEYNENRLTQMQAIALGRSGGKLSPEQVELVLRQAMLKLAINK